MVHARKRFGQHFLEPAWVRKVADAINPKPDDLILEIGPGRGALTRALAASGARIIAVEIDRDLAGDLERAALPNVRIVCGNVLEVDLAEVGRAQVGVGPRPEEKLGSPRQDMGEPLTAEGGPDISQRRGPTPAWARPTGVERLRIVGNLPYNISSPILIKLVEFHRTTGLVSDAVLMLQREVAERVAASPGTRDYGVLSIVIQLHASVERVLILPPGAFRPAPKVMSSVIRLRFGPPRAAVDDIDLFGRLVRGIFTQRRKTLGNALKPFAAGTDRSAAEALARAGIDPRRRPETLALDEVARLANAFST